MSSLIDYYCTKCGNGVQNGNGYRGSFCSEVCYDAWRQEYAVKLLLELVGQKETQYETELRQYYAAKDFDNMDRVKKNIELIRNAKSWLDEIKQNLS